MRYLALFVLTGVLAVLALTYLPNEPLPESWPPQGWPIHYAYVNAETATFGWIDRKGKYRQATMRTQAWLAQCKVRYGE